MNRRQRNVFLVCLVLVVVAATSPARAASVISRRAVAGTGTAEQPAEVPKFCHNSTPCGWAVYVPFTRRVDYFLKNTCDCPRGKSCTRTDDDLSVSAYVYRCRSTVNSTANQNAA